MFILYIDGSGSVGNAAESHFILAGIAASERRIFHLISELDRIVESFGFSSPDDIELHGNQMYAGRGAWQSIPRPRREEMINQALGVLVQSSTGVRAFGVAVNKQARSPDDPVEYAFEEICNRFNLSLQRLYRRRGGRSEDKHKGLVVMDDSHYEAPLQALARDFRIRGTRWGHLRSMAEVPLFVDSKASRMVQLADLIAYAMWRKYEHQDGRFFDPIIPKFDSEGGILHGLVHFHAPDRACYCPACLSRQGNGS